MSCRKFAALADTPLFPLAVVLQILPGTRISRKARPTTGRHSPCHDGVKMERMITMIEAARRETGPNVYRGKREGR